jgi:2-oxoglutarate ferredoxin oxidoreductase subunit gamma
MSKTEIRISGFGGQGVILAAYIIGKAAAVVEGRHATLNQAFGPEARGSACSAQLILSDEPITFPYVRGTDVLVAMSQEAYRVFVNEVKDGGTVLIDDSLVTPEPDSTLRTVGAPASRTAEELGKRIMGNMVMVGLFSGATGLITAEAAREAIRTSVPSGTEEVNLRAFERGLEMGTGVDSPRLQEVVA